MQNLSIKKWSVLGIVLVTASAVTAAVMPSKKSPSSRALLNGTCHLDNGVITCSARLNSADAFSCDISAKEDGVTVVGLPDGADDITPAAQVTSGTTLTNNTTNPATKTGC